MASHNTILQDRVLWYDGSASYDPLLLQSLISRHDVKHVLYNTDEVREYNKHVTKEQEITVKVACGDVHNDWNIPEEYRSLNVVEYVFNRHYNISLQFDYNDIQCRDDRLAAELKLYEKYGLMDVLRTIIWIINKFEEQGVVWGVGRGSSVSSYVLYVIGVHDVDSHLYQLDVKDFLHDYQPPVRDK